VPPSRTPAPSRAAEDRERHVHDVVVAFVIARVDDEDVVRAVVEHRHEPCIITRASRVSRANP
jgi:hypothetical protein